MRILVNASNLVVGGGVQKAVQFVLACRRWGGEHEWRVVVSPQVARGLAGGEDDRGIPVEVVAPSPARPLAGRATRNELRRIETEFRPDVVFSVSGPVYHRFASPHVMGFAVGWLTHPSALAWSTVRPPWRRWAFRLRLAWYARWVRPADGWVLQTDTAARGLAERFALDPHRIHVVPNSCSEYYFEAAARGVEPDPRITPGPAGEERLLVFSNHKPAKNMEIVPEVAARLKEVGPGRVIRFVFTLRPDSAAWRGLETAARGLGVADRLLNVGPVPAFAGPGLYAACTGTFMPTVLETFTATYPESMCMERPIVTSDLDFARDVCGEAAEYFDPTDPVAAAAAVERATADPARRRELVSAGRERLLLFGSGEDRFRSTLSAIIATLEQGKVVP